MTVAVNNNLNALTDSERQSVYFEQVLASYKKMRFATLVGIFAAVFLALIQWSVVSHSNIILWLSLIGATAVFRLVSLFIFYRASPNEQNINLWAKIHITNTFLSGLAWGSSGLLLFAEGMFEYQAATLIVLAGMSSGSVSTWASIKLPAYTYIILALVPISLNFLLVGTDVAFLTGVLCLIYMSFLLVSANQHHASVFENIVLRIQSTGREDKLRKSEQETIKISEILHMIARGEHVSIIYDEIALLYESKNLGLRCSMLELQGSTLLHGGAPSLPQAYCEQVHGLEIGPSVGSCGTACFTGKRVLVENIETDPKWAKIKHIALPHGMRCCWSEPIKDTRGNVLGAFGMYYDYPGLPNKQESADLKAAAQLAGIVMERERREALLVKLSSSFENAQDAIMIADNESRIEYVNPEFERMTGYTAEEAQGEFISLLRSNVHSDQFYQDLADKDSRGEVWRGRIVIKCKDGSLLEVERNVGPVYDTNGELLCIVAIQRDMTDFLAMENNFHQAQKMDAIGNLVGGIAHDFNNILAGITSNLYLAKHYSKGQDIVLKKLNSIDSLSYRAADLIQQLLTFARKDIVDMRQTSFSSLMVEPLALLRNSIPENIKFENQMCLYNLQVVGDGTQLQQILINLVNNAKDAVEHEKSPCIAVDLDFFEPDESFLLKHEGFLEGSYACLSVKDNGSGIPEEDVKHLFEPFFTTKEQGKGTGLGLAMIFGSVQTHGGLIDVSSIEGEGSTFSVYIPLVKERLKENAESQLSERSSLVSSGGHGDTILFADDDVHILEAGQEVLESLGYQVLTAKDGQEAVDIFNEHHNHISTVLMDVVMPEMGGVEAATQMMQTSPDVKVVYMTGYDKHGALPEKIVASGAVLLSKPFNINKLQKVLQNKVSHLESV
ncbi:MAG: ATP-binding protein [Ghiorsea sp.]